MSLLTTLFKLRAPLGVLVRYKQNPCKPSGSSGKQETPKNPCKKVEIKNPCKKEATKNPCKKVETKNPCKKVEAKNPCKKVETKNPCKKVETKNPCKKVETKNPCKKEAPKSPCKTEATKNPCQKVAPKNPCKKEATKSPCKKEPPKNPCKKETKSEKKYECIPNPNIKLRKCGDSKKEKKGPCQSKMTASPCESQLKPNPCQSEPNVGSSPPIIKANPRQSQIKLNPCQSKPIVNSSQPVMTASPCQSQTKPNPCQSQPKVNASQPIATGNSSESQNIFQPKPKVSSYQSEKADLPKPPINKPNICQTVPKSVDPCEAKLSKSAFQGGKPDAAKALTMNTINQNIIKIQYAVRGPLVIRAGALEEELNKGTKKPFSAIIKANIGDAHAMGQVPLTYFRQVLAGALFPELLKKKVFPEDVVKRVYRLLDACGGKSVGSYTGSQGIDAFRRDVARYIHKRDGFECDFNNVFLCAGASTGIKNVLKLFVNKIKNKDTGVLMPIPQYPLYSAAMDEYGLGQCHYYLNEEKNWSLDITELERAFKEHSKKYAIRALVIINPGNPTGQLLSKENVAGILKFAAERNLFIIADEVYQHNIWSKDGRFHSFKKVLMENQNIARQLELASFMTVSKGYFGECGLRGGWCELTNMDPDVQAQLYKACSANLCPSSIGQIAVSCVARPPKCGDPSYELFVKERDLILRSLKERAEMIVETFNSMEGFKCNPVQGALYAFPRFNLPSKAIEAAKTAKQPPDVFYAFQLLEKTGVCIVPGSGFGQKPGTYHFRTTILPQMKPLKQMLSIFKDFHGNFTKQYS